MFYQVSWYAQLTAAVTLFVITAFIEAEVLRQFLEQPLFAYPLAAALEISKAITILLSRYFKLRAEVSYPDSVRILQGTFRTGLIMLSFLATAIFLGGKLDRPLAETIRAQDLARLEQEYAAQSRYLKQTHGAERKLARQEVAEKYSQRIEEADRYHRAAIADLERQVTTEMAVHGTSGEFRGPRYRELMARLDEARRLYQRRLDDLNGSQSEELARLLTPLDQRLATATTALQERFQAQRQAVRETSFDTDPRVYNPLAISFGRMVRAVTGWGLMPLQLTFAIALFVSILTELGIWVGCEVIALSYFPVFDAEAQAAHRLGRKRIAVATDLEDFRLEDAALREKIRVEQDSVEERLKTVTGSGQSAI